MLVDALIYGLAIALSVTMSYAQDENAIFEGGKPELVNGPMQKVAEAIKPILKVKFELKDKQMIIDRKSWGEAETKDDRIAELKAQMFARGMDKATVDRMVERMADQINMTSMRSGPLLALFTKVRTKAGGRRFSSSSGSNGIVTYSTGGPDLDCSLSSSSDTLNLKVVEREGPMRMLDVHSSKFLRFLLTGDDVVVLLQQSKSGVKGVLIKGDKIRSEKSADYYEFCREHPELQAELAAEFRHAGVDLPLGIKEPEVKVVALRMLRSLYSGKAETLDELLKGLDADEFEKREAASRAIAAVYEQFESAIAVKLQGDDLSIEARKRLDKVVNENKDKRKKDTRAEDCVQANQLLSSPDYLIGMLPEADEATKELLSMHLEKITEQKLGSDVEAWKKWLSKTAQ